MTYRGDSYFIIENTIIQYDTIEEFNVTGSVYTVGHEKTRHFYFYDNSDKY